MDRRLQRFAGPSQGLTGDTVRIHIPVLNTRLASELTIRSIVQHTDTPYELVVFDCSTDGTTELLERFAQRGWLETEHLEEPQPHSVFLDRLVPACPTRVGVFVHSDVEILHRGWLLRLLAFQRRAGAAMVVPRITRERANYVEPYGRVVRKIGAVDTCLMAFDTSQVRDVDTSFASWKEETDEVPEGMRISDTGGMYYRELRRRGLVVAELPLRLRLDFRHWWSLSWRPLRRDALAPRIERRVEHLRSLQDGRRRTARAVLVIDRATGTFVVGVHELKRQVRG